MTRALRLGIVILVALVLLLVAAALFLESPWARSWLETQASQRLDGREVVIGDHDIGWGWPLTVTFENVTLANAEWAQTQQDNMANAERAHIAFDTGALLRGRVELRRLALSNAEIHLARDTDGTANWAALTESDDTPQEDRQGLPLQPDEFAVEDSRVTYHDAAQDVAFAVNVQAQARRAIPRDEMGTAGEGSQGNEASQTEDPFIVWRQRIAESLAMLEGYEGQLELTSDTLDYAEQTLRDITVEAALNDGRLNLDTLHLVQKQAEGGPSELNAQGYLEVQEQGLVAEIDAEFDRIDLTAALAPFGLGELGTIEGRLVTRVVEGGLVFDDTQLDYQAPQWDLALSLQANSQDIEGIESPGVNFTGEGTYQDEAFFFDLVVGPLLDLTDDTAPYPVSGELSAGDTHLSLDGSVVQPLQLTEVEGSFRLEGPNPAELSELTGINLPELPPYQVSSHLHYQDDLINLQGMEGSFGESDVAGDVRLRLGETPKVWATLRSSRLDADDLLPMLGIAPETDGSDAASDEQQQWEAQDERQEQVFPDREWDLAGLRDTDIELDYRADGVQARYIPFNDVRLELSLEDGVMRVTPLEVGLGGGTVNANWQMDARQAALQGDMNIEAQQVDLKALLREAELPDVAEDTLGVIGGRGEFTYQGRSLAEVMAGLDGTLKLAMSRGWLDMLAVEILGLDAGEALIAALADSDQVALQCTYAHLEAEDGVVSMEEFFMATEDANITGAGAIGLEDEVIDLAFETHAKDVSVLSADSPIKLEGSLRNPQVNVVTRELLAKGLASLLGAIVAPPTAILPWVDLGGGEDAGIGCERALQEYEQD
ncbi:AsmA family protein [Litchfieldella xinjiangensis]|uniref:AsmA family protein n=1 Tax=Litchfieldella xinjiangensis TaxID=1166948 RepID=UPI0005BC97EF|nr:AsmA family protein [Halomonas xinjiangensis]